MAGAPNPEPTPDAPEILYEPTREEIERSLYHEFVGLIEQRTGQSFGEPGPARYKNVHAWSCENCAQYWDLVHEFADLPGTKGDVTIEKIDRPPYARFYPNGTSSYAEYILRHWIENPEAEAIAYRHQDGTDIVWTGQDLVDEVSKWEQAFKKSGVQKGDYVGIYLTNRPESIAAFIAAANIGAPVVTAGMEMGGDDMIERFARVSPKVLVTADSYTHGARVIDRTDVLKRAHAEIPSLEKTVLLPSTAGTQNVEGLENTETQQTYLDGIEAQEIEFHYHEFNHLLYTLFTSGTTGEPKGPSHSSGGVALKHAADYMIQSDVRKGDVVFYHATPSWMMWHWLVSGLGAGAKILLSDGDPASPDAKAQLRFAADHKCTHYGTSAAVVQDILMANDVNIIDDPEIDFSSCRMLMSTGGILTSDAGWYIKNNIKSDMMIVSITGGTDFVSVSIGGSPETPCYAGQLSGPYLGMDVQSLDDDAEPAGYGEMGELGIRTPFPSQPIELQGDTDGSLYHDEYFSYFDDVCPDPIWRHGDTIIHGAGFEMVGRSDGILNQNDVRIGPAKLYKQLTQERIGDFAKLIKGAAAVDYMTPEKKPKTMLFLEMEDWQDGILEEMEKAIKTAIRNNVGPYSVPTKIIPVPGILRTKNGKISEVVTKKIIGGKSPRNRSLYGEELVAHYEQIRDDLDHEFGATASNDGKRSE